MHSELGDKTHTKNNLEFNDGKNAGDKTKKVFDRSISGFQFGGP